MAGPGYIRPDNAAMANIARAEVTKWRVEAEKLALQRKSKTDKMFRMPLLKLAETIGGEKGRVVKIALMSTICEHLVNYGKAYGPWNDQTGNLRRSYTWFVKPEGQDVLGYFVNTASYAKYVEYKPGLWVLRGAFIANRKAIRSFLGRGMTYRVFVGDASPGTI